jgi:homoserine O-acetyltransferase
MASSGTYSLLPAGAGKTLQLQAPLPLDSGKSLESVQVAYETYGTLNADKSNAVLLCHALTADQFAASDHPVTGKPGWWAHLIGPGKIIDTDRYFVICSNVLGGCMGTTGPMSENIASGEPYGLSLPVITLGDMARAQFALVDHLGIETLMAVIGGSMGGMQVLQWAADYPERVFAAAPIATAARHTAQNIAFHEVGRQAVMADPAWQSGAYYANEERPQKGLAVARMAAHVTYLSEEALERKFGRNLQDRETIGFSFDADFQIESYLRHQGKNFISRFDANSYLYITRAMDYFDLGGKAGLAARFQGSRTRFLLTSFTSDWLYPTTESRHIVKALHGAGVDVSFVEIESDKGHDAFLLEELEFFEVLGGWLGAVAQARGVA